MFVLVLFGGTAQRKGGDGVDCSGALECVCLCAWMRVLLLGFFFFLQGRGFAGAQGLNNSAETSSIMKGPPEGYVSPRAVPLLRHCPGLLQKKPDTDAVELWLRGSVFEEAEVVLVGNREGGREGPEQCKAKRLSNDLVSITRS